MYSYYSNVHVYQCIGGKSCHLIIILTKNLFSFPDPFTHTPMHPYIHTAQLLKGLPALAKYRHKNHITSAFLLTPVIGAYLGATVVGKNESYQITHIFEQHTHPTSSYQKQVQSNKMAMTDDVRGSYDRRRQHLASRKEKEKGVASRETGSDLW